MPATRNQLLARLHCLKKDMGLDDDAYRAILEARTGKRSAGELDSPTLARVVAALGVQKPLPADEWAWVNTSPEEKKAMLWKIRQLCKAFRDEKGKPLKRGGHVAYAEGIAKRQHGVERKLQMMDVGEIYKLVGALQNTINHQK
jgi:phage gp16-like protein